MWKLARLLTVFRRELLLAWSVLRGRGTPWPARLITLLALAYILSPVDLLTDFLPMLGWLDDGLVAWLLLQVALRFIPPDQVAALRHKVRTRWPQADAAGPYPGGHAK